LLAIAALPFLVWLTDSLVGRVLFSLLGGSLVVIVIFVAIVTAIVLSLLKEFWHRAVVLEDLGLGDVAAGSCCASAWAIPSSWA
jgi:hypothetical protein